MLWPLPSRGKTMRNCSRYPNRLLVTKVVEIATTRPCVWIKPADLVKPAVFDQKMKELVTNVVYEFRAQSLWVSNFPEA
jgi:hypothetical protein